MAFKLKFKFKLSERSRNLIAIALVIINCIAILFLLYLFYTGIYTYVYIKESARLLDKQFSVGFLGALYMIIAFIVLVEHSLLCFALYYARRSKRRKNLIKSRYLVYISRAYATTAVIVIPAVIIYTYTQMSTISKEFESGMHSKMKEYGRKIEQKIILDHLQYDYECCGAESYKDWFRINWVHPRYEKDHHFTKSTPFSCCRRAYLGPCHSEGITNDEDSETLNSKGCAKKFSKSLHNILYKAITLWILVLIIQLLTSLLFQYWRISIQNALLKGHPKYSSYGWLWSEKSLLKEKDRDRELRKRLLSPVSDDSQSDFEIRGEKEILPQSYIDLYDDTRTPMHSQKQNISLNLTKTSKLPNPPKPPNLPKLRKLPAPPQPSPRSKHYRTGKRELVVDFRNKPEKCSNCQQLVYDKEPHQCLTHDHSLALISTIESDAKQLNSHKAKSSVSSNRKVLLSDINSSVDSTETSKQNKVSHKSNDNNSENHTDSEVADRKEEIPKRKYNERYFILKEIR